jgi:tetratricopeptide (TPR) repeat protein
MMKFGTLTAQFRRWERPAQVALLLALALMVLVLGIGAFGADDLRQPALIGFFGLFIMMQIIIMWANRSMVTDFTRAQRRYLAEDFEGARTLLENLRAADQADAQELTLLGNTYRQLGDVESSEAILLEALDKRPEHHFPLYGFGRTLLVSGRYAEAAQTIQQAVAAGAPPVVQVDLAEAHYRAGAVDEARTVLETLEIADEPPRRLLVAYLRHQLNAGNVPAHDLIEAGLPYWQATAGRFHHTQYGQDLLEDIRSMQALL